MTGHAPHRDDLEAGASFDYGPETGEGCSSLGSEGRPTGKSSSEGSSRTESQKQPRDFDDGANALWSLYGKEAQTHDKARFESVAKDMDGVLVFAGLFSAVLASFLVQSLQALQVNPADQSVYYLNQSAYYQQQSVAMLAQILQQLTPTALQGSDLSTAPQNSTAPTVLPSSSTDAQQVPIPSAPPPPFPPFTPSSSDLRVNAFWLVGLVCSLSAALLAILIQQWVRSYMQVFQQYDHPLKRARFRQFFFEGANGMRKLAKQVPRLILVSLFLFFVGLCDSMLNNTNTTVGVTTVVPICLCGTTYLYFVTIHLTDRQSPYKTLVSHPIFFLIQQYQQLFGDHKRRTLKTYKTFEAYREELVMDEKERKKRDVRAIRWLVDNTAATGEIEPLVLAIPGTFNTEWGLDVWADVSSQGPSEPDALDTPIDRSAADGLPSPILPSPLSMERPLEGTAVDTISRSVRNLFETCRNHSYFESKEARRRRMHACVEAAASLVCCIDFRLEWLGEVGQLVNEIGNIEQVNQSPTTISDPSFVVRWTCLSLVAVQQIMRSKRLQVLAGYAVSGLARFQLEYGRPDETGWRSAQRIEECLKTAWKLVEELHQAFEPSTQKRTKKQVEDILRNHEQQISELEHIKVEAEAMEDVDWRISLCRDEMDEATFRLTRQLPGVSFDERRQSESSLISDIFNAQATGSGPVTPQLILPGQQVQALARLGSKLREFLDGQLADGHKEVLETLKAVDQVPFWLRRPDGLMTRQLWRLQDLRDGGGHGFMIELFFLSLRQLLSIPSLHVESNGAFYTGTFKIIISKWEESKESLGTQCILLNLVCDLIIRDRGAFSGFLYPEHITTSLLDMMNNMFRVFAGPDGHVRDAVWEIEDVDSLRCMDIRLRDSALVALRRFHGT